MGARLNVSTVSQSWTGRRTMEEVVQQQQSRFDRSAAEGAVVAKRTAESPRHAQFAVQSIDGDAGSGSCAPYLRDGRSGTKHVGSIEKLKVEDALIRFAVGRD